MINEYYNVDADKFKAKNTFSLHALKNYLSDLWKRLKHCKKGDWDLSAMGTKNAATYFHIFKGANNVIA